MYNINPCFKTKKILAYIADLIVSYDYKQYDDLSDTEKYGLVALLNEAGGRDDELSFLTEGCSTELLLGLFRKSLAGDKADNDAFAEALKEHAIDYYDHTIQQLFRYVYDDYQEAKVAWLGHVEASGDLDQSQNIFLEGLA